MGRIRLADMVHPEYTERHEEWLKWGMAYEGGRKFIEKFAYRYSGREKTKDLKERLQLAYNPGHTKVVLNMIRNSITSKLPEVVRKGDPRYLDFCDNDVDFESNGMNTFLGLKILPLLMAHSKRFVAMDAPAVVPGATVDEDAGRPYIWAVDAMDWRNWNIDEDGRLQSCLAREMVDIIDDEYALVTSRVKQYRYYRLINKGQTIMVDGMKYKGKADKNQVLVRILDEKSNDKQKPLVMNLSRIPISVNSKLVHSLVEDIADIQVALLNLNAADVQQCFRGNFPLFTKQFDPTKRMIRPAATKRPVKPGQETELLTRTMDDDFEQEQTTIGVNKGVGYAKDLDPPSYIAPPTANLEVSMAKQQAMKEEIRILLDLSLVSMATKALEQSGKSKDADNLGLERGLAYIGGVLKAVESDIAALYHEFIGSKAEYDVTYPSDYELITEDEAIVKVEKLDTIQGTVRSETFQKKVQKKKVRIIFRGADPAELSKMDAEIDAGVWFDESSVRATTIASDVLNKLVSTETASKIRGYPDGEMALVQGETEAATAAMTGYGPNGEPKPGDPNADPGNPSKFPPADPSKDPSLDPNAEPALAAA